LVAWDVDADVWWWWWWSYVNVYVKCDYMAIASPKIPAAFIPSSSSYAVI
jgi:hypothetical protein